MSPNDFVYWLQGFMEIANPNKLNESQTQIIKDHLALVLNKQTPARATTGALWIVPPTGADPLEEFMQRNPRVTCSNNQFPNIKLCSELTPSSC